MVLVKRMVANTAKAVEVGVELQVQRRQEGPEELGDVGPGPLQGCKASSARIRQNGQREPRFSSKHYV